MSENTMKAIMVPKPGSLIVGEIPMERQPEHDEVMVQIMAGGICGSDIHVYHGRSAFATYPRIIGHEISGKVCALGDGVTDVKIGDAVAINPLYACGKCYACSIGRPNVCKNLRVMGAHIDGGFRQYVTAARANVHLLPETASWEEGALIEPFTIAAESIDRGSIVPHERVLVCGAGPIGAAVLQAVRLSGAEAMIIDALDERLKTVKEMWSECVTVNPAKDDVTRRVKDWTNGEGASLIIEATGNIKVMESCISSWASQAGRVVTLGFASEFMQIKPSDIMSRELDIRGSRLNNNKFPVAIDWLKKGLIQPKAIISHRFFYEDVAEAFKLINEHPEQTLKIVLNF